AGAPAADFDLAAPKDAPTALRIVVVRVENPSKQGVSIASALRAQGPGTEAAARTLGTVTLYPSDQPGAFTVTLPPEARADLARAAAARVTLTLQSAVTGRPLAAPLAVVVATPSWR